tara:strand:+ start:5922 stop:6302 length:381 start_codon:yes stop_codon:yes gene_type:complete
MKKIIINTRNAPAAIGPYSQAVLVDKTLYCSGQIAINPKNNLIMNNSIAEETEMIMKNIYEILISAQMNFDNIVKCTIFLKNMDNYNEVNKVYSKYFKNDPPAREAVEVSKLPKNVNVEISSIAVK